MWLGLFITIFSAFGFEITQNEYAEEIGWDEMPVYWALDTEAAPAHLTVAEQQTAIREAFAAWNNIAGAHIEFIEATPSTPEDKINWVLWDNDWAWDEDIVALTSTWSTESGQIVGFQIAINAVNPTWTTEEREGMDLQNALTHEVGHVLGLDHSMHSHEATMYPSAVSGERSKRDLFWDDEQGARFLYPSSQAGSGPFPMSCSSVSSIPGWMTAFLPLLVLARRRVGSRS